MLKHQKAPKASPTKSTSNARTGWYLSSARAERAIFALVCVFVISVIAGIAVITGPRTASVVAVATVIVGGGTLAFFLKAPDPGNGKYDFAGFVAFMVASSALMTLAPLSTAWLPFSSSETGVERESQQVQAVEDFVKSEKPGHDWKAETTAGSGLKTHYCSFPGEWHSPCLKVTSGKNVQYVTFVKSDAFDSQYAVPDSMKLVPDSAKTSLRITEK